MTHNLKLFKHFPFRGCINQIREYAFKSDLKIKWIRPEKVSCYKPEKSGDLEVYPQIEQKQVHYAYKNCKELETADELVQKLFTLEYSSRRASVGHFINETASRVRRHLNDYGSHEVTIARMTGVIRAMQVTMDRFPRNKVHKVILKELIDKRKKYLKYLRRWDYKKFEWLLEVLNLSYKPMPLDVHWITRKDSLRKLTDKYCDGVKADRLKELKLKFQAEQPAFLEQKFRTLQFIRDEQQACGVDVTVSQEEIDGVKQQLEDLMNQLKSVRLEEENEH